MTSILLLNGYACESWIWDEFRSNLNPEVSVDVLDWPVELLIKFHNISDYTIWLKNKLNNKRYDYIIGHSMGGLVALELSTECNIDNLILVESFITTPKEFFRNLIFDESNLSLLDAVQSMLKKESSFYSKKLANPLKVLDVSEHIINTNSNIHLIYGDRGNDSKQQILEHLNFTKVVEDKVDVSLIENCCHFPMIENPEKFNRIILSIIS